MPRSRIGKISSVLALAGCLLGASVQAEPLLFRISTENTSNHVQTRVVEHFARILQEKAAGQLDVRHFHGAELFRDRDVIRAMAMGQVEMAVPGTWQLDRYAPSVGVLMLPMFFGRDIEVHHTVRDGPLGARLNDDIANAIDAVVVGRWIDLGLAHLFFTEIPVRNRSELAGLRIRVAGGEANLARLRSVSATPMIIAWPDLPLSLAKARIDGLLTTYETVASASLGRQGIRYGLETQDYFAQYVPIVSRDFWNRLAPELQTEIARSWEAVVDAARSEADLAQRTAKATLAGNGMTILKLGQSDLAEWRQAIAQDQAELAVRLGIPLDVIEIAKRALGE